MLCLVTQKDSAKMAQKSPIAKITAKKNDLRFVKKGSLFGGEDYFFVILRLKWLLCRPRVEA